MMNKIGIRDKTKSLEHETIDDKESDDNSYEDFDCIEAYLNDYYIEKEMDGHQCHIKFYKR